MKSTMQKKINVLFVEQLDYKKYSLEVDTFLSNFFLCVFLFADYFEFCGNKELHLMKNYDILKRQ